MTQVPLSSHDLLLRELDDQISKVSQGSVVSATEVEQVSALEIVSPAKECWTEVADVVVGGVGGIGGDRPRRCGQVCFDVGLLLSLEEIKVAEGFADVVAQIARTKAWFLLLSLHGFRHGGCSCLFCFGSKRERKKRRKPASSLFFLYTIRVHHERLSEYRKMLLAG